MFLLIVLSIWTLLHAYVFWRLSTVPAIQRRLSRQWLIAAGALAWTSFLAAQIVEAVASGRLVWLLQLVASDWLGILFLLFVSLLAADLITGFGYLLPRLAPSIRNYALLAGVVLSLIAIIQGTRAPVVSRHEVQVSNLPPSSNGLVIVVISDLHLGTLLGPHWLAARVEQIHSQRPDLIVLAGDIIEGHGRHASEFLSLLRALSAPLGVWAVNGNHEGHGERAAGTQLLRDAGFRMLSDTWAELQPGLLIAGVDDLTSRRRRGGRDGESVDQALAGRPAGAATIFVSHTPWQSARAARAGARLMLSAHTHNGQIWPFNYIVKLWYPLTAGRYDVAGMPVIVCRGTGTWGPRMRLWSRGEILRITLRPAP